MAQDKIIIRGASEHNLKHVSLDLPRDRLIVFSGVSGSGKSSLAFDTIFREGQRRYVESLSAYARQFIGQREKPKVDHIEGLSPTVAIDQKTTNRNPRSTVGTITEIYDYLRLLFARVGTPHCPKCGTVIAAKTPQEVVEQLLHDWAGRHITILAPIVRGRKGEYRAELEGLRVSGYRRVKVDGVIHTLDTPIALDRYKKHDVSVVIDRLDVEQDDDGRLTEGVENAVKMASGLVIAEVDDQEHIFSCHLSCPKDGFSVEELEPRSFSFNVPQGACPTCDGLGRVPEIDLSLLLPNPDKSIRQGAFAITNDSGTILYSRLGIDGWEQMAKAFGFSIDTPWKDLTDDARELILRGSGKRTFRHAWAWDSSTGNASGKGVSSRKWEGIIPLMVDAYTGSHAHHIERYMAPGLCHDCKGQRLKPESLAVTIDGKNIADIAACSAREIATWIDRLASPEVELLTTSQVVIAQQVLREIRLRVGFLIDVGLDYLTIDRNATTLAGGEAQRIRLATQVGAGLQGVTYVLDEPSIGLHQRDNRRLLSTLHRLRDNGNTVLVVEHDDETLKAADWVVDVGPGPGVLGGEIVAQGRPEDVARVEASLTGQFLRGDLFIPAPTKRRRGHGTSIGIRGAREHNLKNVSVDIPLGTFLCVTGVSGSGKSTLVDDVLKVALARALHNAGGRPGAHDEITGIEHIDKVIEIDQSPIGRTPRSNPATYTGAFDHIRDLFSKLPESRVRGYKPGRFSFNVKGGRCEACEGDGTKKIEMQFMADVEVLCDACDGRRFNHETLDVRFKGATIFDVLEMQVLEARDFFEHVPPLARILQTLVDVGLGYLALGQSSTTLSGGEAQRIKLASELSRPATGRTFYILDEPTTGLHIADVRKLIDVLQRLVDVGNTVLVIEHHPDVIKVADHIIDMGPEGGQAGGAVVAQGTPEDIMAVEQSYTGRLLHELLHPAQPHDGIAESPTAYQAAPQELPVSDSVNDQFITVYGAHKHNLKHIDVSIPKQAMTVITGVSGSGKSTLALDTLFAEGQRRFVECLSSYTRQFLGRRDAADVDRVEGLAPAIAIDQANSSRSPRSTVATTTEMYDYLRLLYARAGTPHCINGHGPLAARTSSQMVQQLFVLYPDGGQATLLAPLGEVRGQSEELLRQLGREGFLRIVVDGEIQRIDELVSGLGSDDAHALELVVDRLPLDADGRGRIADSVELALSKGAGRLIIEGPDGSRHAFSQTASCPVCMWALEQEMAPRLFSFNSHVGACPSCHGLGVVRGLDPRLVVPDGSKSYMGGAIAITNEHWRSYGSRRFETIDALAQHYGFTLYTPWNKLLPEHQDLLLFGTSGQRFRVEVQSRGRSSQWNIQRDVEWEGLIPKFMRWYRESTDPEWQQWLEAYMSEVVCTACDGERLKPIPRAVFIDGKNIAAACRQSVDDARQFFSQLSFPARTASAAAQLLKEVNDRLQFLSDVGLGYLTLDRSAATLSGGESQRVRLATQIGSKLVGVLYVLDEPSIGLHPRDIDRLLASLRTLRDLGNTLILVEHDAATIEAADHVLELGPGAGLDGGHVVASGTLAEFTASPTSLTAQYMRGEKGLTVPERRGAYTKTLRIRGATEHNLKGIDVDIPLERFVVVTGVSGSGKSTLVGDIVARALARQLHDAHEEPGTHTDITGIEHLIKVIAVDQDPIGRSPKSNPATYTGVFETIRDFFANLPEARVRGFRKGRFSFNDRTGQCPACKGDGTVSVNMHFLADVTVPCDACGGLRYNTQTLRVKYRGESIADVLRMTIGEAADLFEHVPDAHRVLATLVDVGLGYMQLGQPAPTLSRGEAQRLKLATELCRPNSGQTVYILDEPTTGLHYADIDRLVAILQRLVNKGNSVVVIEHNLDVIKVADHVIDLGPEGGDGGGYIVATGTPEAIAACNASHTGHYLAPLLRRERVTARHREPVVV